MYVDQLAAQANLPRSPDNNVIDGIVVQGSYDPAEGTVEVLIGDTAVVFTDFGDAPTTIVCNLLTTGIGQQYGPRGGERATCFRTSSGYSCLIEHGPDDTPNAPSGEWVIGHRNADGVYDSIIHLTNDGPETGDGLGGTMLGGTGALTQILTSAADLSSVYNAITKKLQHTAGPVFTLYDGLGNEVAHVVGTGGKIGMGKAFADLASTDAAAAQTHISEFSDSMLGDCLQSLMSITSAAMVLASPGGVFNAVTYQAIVTAAHWITSNITPPTIPDCSQVLRIASSV